MQFLKITAATTGIATYIPDNQVVNITVAANTADAGTAYRAPNVVRGLITGVKYLDGAAAAAVTVTAVAGITAYAGTATAKYEYGVMTHDGAFTAVLSNVTGQ
jgi:hypothetical protein